MKRQSGFFRALFTLTCLLAFSGGTAQGVPLQTGTPITGEVEAITLTNPGNVWSDGTMRVGGQNIILPSNLLINLPNDYQSLQQLFTNAPPACQLTGESGLAKIDRCNDRSTGALVTILANRTDSGNVIAGQVDLVRANETVQGTITYIDIPGGYFRVNGNPNDPTTGVMVRVNDPPVGAAGGRHTVQSGPGCAPGNTLNCSPDTRFRIDPDNYTFCYITGYPACIPTSANDANCPLANRPPITPIITSNPFASPPVAADSRHFAPLQLGDTVKADGFYATVGGVTFLSAASVRVMVDLTTRTVDPLTGAPDPTQPNYLIINEASWDGPAYPAGRVRGRLLTNSTIHDSEIDFFSIHFDPFNNAPHERPLYTTRFNKQFGVVVFNVPTGVSDSQIRYDFFPGAAGQPGGKTVAGQEPCASFWGTEPKATGSPVLDLAAIGINVSSFCPDSTGLGIVDNFNVMVPIFREVMARTTRSETPGAVTGVALDIHGRPTQSGFYKLPVTIDYGAFEDINLGMGQFPYQFSGNPFLLDRRLSPNGCVGACETTQQPLTPFPFEGINPNDVAPTYGFVVAGVPTSIPNTSQMFTFMQANGSFTGLLTWPPTNPGALPITPTAGLNLFPPIADEDSAVTTVGVPVTISVLANDIAPFGTIDPASVLLPTTPTPGILQTLPSGATVQVNPSGTITYTPAPTFAGLDSFTYTVADNFASRSLPGTVTVDVRRAPVAVNDTASASAGSTISIDVVANDVVGTSLINRSTINVVSGPGAGCGSVVNNPVDGVLIYNAPAAVPTGGLCSFSYVVSDTSVPPLISNVATVSVTITPPVPPVANPESATTTTGSTVIIPVLANDTSAVSPLNPASVSVTAPTGGTAFANPDGTVSYTAPSAVGIYTFTYTVKNSTIPATISNVATVTVTVTQGHIAPVAVNDTATVATGSSVLINVLANDTASAGSALNPASLTVSAPTSGTAAVNPSGTVTYTPNGVLGVQTFSYTVKDNAVPPAVSNSATVSVTVTAGTALPSGTISINGGAALAKSTAVTLSLSATSPNGPVTQMQFTLDGGAFSALEPFAATRAITLLSGDGAHTVGVRFVDSIGKVSPTFTASITLDTVPPTGTLGINGGALLTIATAVTLNTSATDLNGVKQMQFSNDGVNFFAPIPYATSATSNLTTGDGLKTMLVRYIDAAGNVSAPISATITLNTSTLPTGVALFPISMTFSTPVGTSSTSQTVTLVNTSKAAVLITSITKGGANPADFNLTGNCPVAGSLGAGLSCTMNVSFHPTATGTRTATITLVDSDSTSPQTISLTGTNAGVLSLSSTSMAFGNQIVATSSAQTTTTLTASSAAFFISGITKGGSNPGDFNLTGNCPVGGWLGAGVSCSLNVSFRPSATGTRTAAISIASSSPTSPQTVGLTGSGVAPVLAVSPASINFGNQAQATTSAAQPILVANSGTGTLTINGITLGGVNSNQYLITSNTCGSTLAAGAFCTVNVAFLPTSAGATSATLNIGVASPGTSGSVALSGTGL